ncbi:MAG: histone deacetylase [Spirochaetales bacterium]
MILTDERLRFHFTDFGILVPIRESKVVRVLEFLESHPSLAGKAWKLDPLTEVVTEADLRRVHSSSFVDRLYHEVRCADEILKAYELVDASGNYHRYAPETATKPLSGFFGLVLLHVAGTVSACRVALKTGFAFFLGGGMHHAHFDHGTGFCLVNDLVIAARKLQAEHAVQDVWIIDIDAHKGDGTASLTQGDDTLLTLSLHMADSWPLDEPTRLERGESNPSLILSDVDIGMRKGEDDRYLYRLEAGLEELERLALERRGRLPDLALVVDGSDPYEKDELPSTADLQLTLPQMLQRDLMVDTFLTRRGIPAAWVNAGGYGDSVWEVYAQFLGAVLPGKLGS